MELLQLRYFLVAAQYQHITKAAEHLRIAQPALSQSIHRLEAELGVPLFTRQNRSIELNEEGRFLQQRLIPILHSLDQIPEELQKGKYQMNHTIHLRLLSASSLITSRIIAYRSLHPEVSFQLYQNPDQDDNFAYLHGGLILFQSTVPTMTLRTMSWSCWRRSSTLPFQLIQILVRKQQSASLRPETRIISALPVPALSGRLPTAILKRRDFLLILYLKVTPRNRYAT